jgi:hypothetical protein
MYQIGTRRLRYVAAKLALWTQERTGMNMGTESGSWIKSDGERSHA